MGRRWEPAGPPDYRATGRVGGASLESPASGCPGRIAKFTSLAAGFKVLSSALWAGAGAVPWPGMQRAGTFNPVEPNKLRLRPERIWITGGKGSEE